MIVGILQARISSTRLPGKVIKMLHGRPMIIRQLERIDRCQMIEKTIVATSDNREDDILAHIVDEEGVPCYRGSLENVLERVYKAAMIYRPDHVVRLTGDCPLIDPNVVDLTIKQHLKQDNDYTANCIDPTYPDGLDVEVMTYSALEKAAQNAKLPSELEHVTLYFRNNEIKFKIGHVRLTEDLSHLRWTVDEPEDFEFVEVVFNRLFSANPQFTMNDILQLLQNEPELKLINHGLERNKGLRKSLNLEKREQK